MLLLSIQVDSTFWWQWGTKLACKTCFQAQSRSSTQCRSNSARKCASVMGVTCLPQHQVQLAFTSTTFTRATVHQTCTAQDILASCAESTGSMMTAVLSAVLGIRLTSQSCSSSATPSSVLSTMILSKKEFRSLGFATCQESTVKHSLSAMIGRSAAQATRRMLAMQALHFHKSRSWLRVRHSSQVWAKKATLAPSKSGSSPWRRSTSCKLIKRASHACESASTTSSSSLQARTAPS